MRHDAGHMRVSSGWRWKQFYFQVGVDLIDQVHGQLAVNHHTG
jgi:hypothetical protein